MPKFKKAIVKPGVHRVRRVDGKEEAEVIPAERIKTWAENTKRLIALGVKIPAPFVHQDKDHKLVTPLTIGTDGASLSDGYKAADLQQNAWDQSINSGFWEDYSVGPDGELIGVLDSPGAEDDDKTPAGKIGKTYRESSVFVLPSCTVRGADGNFHEIGEHLAHVAVCLHGQEPNQSNFEPIAATTKSLGMAMMFGMADMISPATQPNPGLPKYNQATPMGGVGLPQDEELNELLGLFQGVGISLPEDTTRDNLIERLRLVLRQKLADEQKQQQEEESALARPADGTTKAPSIAMSATTAPDPGASGAQATPTKPGTAEAILMGMLHKDKRKSLTDRVNALVSSGRITKEYADTKLLPRVSAFVMSQADLLPDGTGFKTSDLEELIEGLEQAQPLAGPSLVDDAGYGATIPIDSLVQDLPAGGENIPSDETYDAILERSLGHMLV
jgi:hypothetical protein